jgi:hypothetical protein
VLIYKTDGLIFLIPNKKVRFLIKKHQKWGIFDKNAKKKFFIFSQTEKTRPSVFSNESKEHL